MEKILLHVCCGPCAIACVESLLAQNYTVTGIFYNPNIHPLSEYLKRRDGAVEVFKRFNCELQIEDMAYKPQDFFHRVHNKEQDRCACCYDMRFEYLAEKAKEQEYKIFTSTLFYSKYQNHELMNISAHGHAKSQGIRFLEHDFRPLWEHGIALSKEWEIYRQNYCGCLYSEFERHAKKLKKIQN